MKKALSLFLVVLMLVGMLPMTAINAFAAEGKDTELAIIANTGIVADEGKSISWTSGNVTFKNEQASSTSAILTTDATYFRAYAHSAITISTTVGKITKIVVTCTSTSYASALVNAVGAEATADSATVTIVPTTPADTYAVADVTKQVRLNKVVVTTEEEGDTTECAHTNTTNVDPVAATCTTPGFTAGVYCNDCKTYTEGHEVVPSTGHTMGDWDVVTAATCTEAGEQTRGCANCDLVETQAIAALGHNYENGVCTGCGNVAVMTQYELVTDATSLKTGDQLVFVGANADGAYSAMLAYVSGNNLKAETINAPVDGKISLPDTSAAAIITLGGDSTGWTFFDGAKYLYAAGKASNNYLKGIAELPEDNTGAWTIVIDENGIATITNVGNTGDGARNTIFFNYTNNLFAAYKADYSQGAAKVSLYRLATGGSEGGEGGSEACAHANQTTTTVDATCTEAGSVTIVCDDCGETISTEEIAALGHNYVDNICSRCGAEFEGEIDTPDPETPAEDVKIIFQLGENKEAVHADGTAATEYTETVDGYTLNITEGNKMYTGAADAKGNSCIKLGTSSVVGSFKFTVPADVREVVICVAKYKAKPTTISVNGTERTLENSSDNGAYDEITVDTSNNKTVTLTTVSGGVRAMVNSITYVCGEKDHDCQWDNGVVTTEATCTTDGEMTYSCTVDGCTITKTEKIPAGHKYDADGNCTACGITPAQVVANAYALEVGKYLEGTYTLTGVIKGVDTAYDEKYQNVSVIIDVIGVTDMPILCYRMKGEGADQIGTGDTITVTGSLMRYDETKVEFAAGCTLDKWEDTGAEFVRPETPEEIVNAAYALEVGTTLEGGTYTLTGVITSVDYAYSAKNADITIVIQIGDMTEKLIKCFRLKGEGAELICVGDTVTVTGNLKNYNGTVEFDSGCTLDSYVINKGHTEEIDAAVDATCTEAGKTEGKHCSVCNLVIVAQEDVPGHTIEHVAAVVPANCQETGHDEYWYCATCDIYYGDAEYSYEVNPGWIFYTGEHVRPEGTPVCAVVKCTLCGEDSYGETCTRPDGAPECQDATCVNCGETIPGWGCNYNTGEEETPLPLCQPGDCVYCGKHYDKLYNCENGAWAPCLEGECSYGCGAKFPATEAHTVDPCVGGLCETCWENIEGIGHDHSGENGVCIHCGEYQADANLVFANTALNLESAIGFQNVIMKKAYKDYDSFYVELVRDGKTTIVEPMLSNNYYTAYDIPVLPIDMTEEFTLTIYGVKEGVVYRGEVLTTSVMSFAMKLLEGYAQDESKAAVCRVLVDMLNYGAEVQKAFATEIGILANANLGEYASLGTTGDITINAAEVKTGTATVKILQDAFNLDARVEIQVLISNKTAPAGTVFRYTVGNAETVEIPVSEFTAYGSAYSYVAFSFAPLQFRETVVYGFYNPTTDEAVSEVYTTSIEACATEKLTDAAVGDLVVFMMKYGDATKAYVESLTA